MAVDGSSRCSTAILTTLSLSTSYVPRKPTNCSIAVEITKKNFFVRYAWATQIDMCGNMLIAHFGALYNNV